MCIEGLLRDLLRAKTDERLMVFGVFLSLEDEGMAEWISLIQKGVLDLRLQQIEMLTCLSGLHACWFAWIREQYAF